MGVSDRASTFRIWSLYLGLFHGVYLRDHQIIKNKNNWSNKMSTETGAAVSKQKLQDLKGRMLALKEHL